MELRDDPAGGRELRARRRHEVGRARRSIRRHVQPADGPRLGRSPRAAEPGGRRRCAAHVRVERWRHPHDAHTLDAAAARRGLRAGGAGRHSWGRGQRHEHGADLQLHRSREPAAGEHAPPQRRHRGGHGGPSARIQQPHGPRVIRGPHLHHRHRPGRHPGVGLREPGQRVRAASVLDEVHGADRRWGTGPRGSGATSPHVLVHHGRPPRVAQSVRAVQLHDLLREPATGAALPRCPDRGGAVQPVPAPRLG